MSNEDDFYVGYGAMPNKDRRFLLKALPLGLLGLSGAGAFIGTRAGSQGGGRWETGTPVTLKGRIGFHPYPVLWVDGVGHVIAGIGKLHADPYVKPFDGQAVEVRGVKIVRNDCFMLGVAVGDIKPTSQTVAAIPKTEILDEVSLVGEILDAQCFMGIMNPGYGRTHRGCATLCIRGGQPVFFSMGLDSAAAGGGATGCAGIGHLLANANGDKINDEILGHISVPLTLSARHQMTGNLSQLIYQQDSLKRL
ncbi:MAG: hypothetical protein ABJ275_03905 [Maricaulaceae bacterium]